MISLPRSGSSPTLVTARLLSAGSLLPSSSWQHPAPPEELAMLCVHSQALKHFSSLQNIDAVKMYCPSWCLGDVLALTVLLFQGQMT